MEHFWSILLQVVDKNRMNIVFSIYGNLYLFMHMERCLPKVGEGWQMCPECTELSKAIKIDHPHEYFRLIEQLKDLVQTGTFKYEGNCKLEEIKEGSIIPEHLTFWCSSCGQRFGLDVDTYHGGGAWAPSQPSRVREYRSGPLISELKRERKPLRKMNLTEEERAALREKLRGKR
jgi:hypothetical protein